MAVSRSRPRYHHENYDFNRGFILYTIAFMANGYARTRLRYGNSKAGRAAKARMLRAAPLFLFSFAIVFAIAGFNSANAQVPPQSKTGIDTFNYVLGTQTIDAKYKFTDKPWLDETADRILEMGSNIIKIEMGGYSGDVQSLKDSAEKNSSIRAVLDMPFAYYFIWAHTNAMKKSGWRDGLSEEESKSEYREMYDFASYLLKRYEGTGKTFFLGHWEGDWMLLGGTNAGSDPGPKAEEGMIAWLNIRQKAIDDARRDARAKGVYVFNYAEVNLVQKGMLGKPCMINDVIPHTNVDYVSYSAYDTVYSHLGDTEKALSDALDYIESKLPRKEGVPGKRVFIGEYGFSREMTGSPMLQDMFARDVSRAAMKWGCPFALYWEMYNNEIGSAGKQRGFWLIDDKNKKQPFYYSLEKYYKLSKRFVAEFEKRNGRPPNADEFRAAAVKFLK